MLAGGEDYVPGLGEVPVDGALQVGLGAARHGPGGHLVLPDEAAAEAGIKDDHLPAGEGVEPGLELVVPDARGGVEGGVPGADVLVVSVDLVQGAQVVAVGAVAREVEEDDVVPVDGPLEGLDGVPDPRLGGLLVQEEGDLGPVEVPEDCFHGRCVVVGEL